MKLSTQKASQNLTPRLWPAVLAALAAALIAWGAVRELFQAQESLSAVFSPLGQVFARLLSGEGSAAAAAGRFISKWGLTSLELLIAVAILALGLAVGLVAARRRSTAGRAFMGLRDRFPWLGVLLAVLIVVYPAFLLLGTYWGEAFSGPYVRLLLLLAGGLLAAACLPVERGALLTGRSALLGLALAGSVFSFAGALATVNSYPFSLTWSEGNRIYEYSLYFRPEIYQYDGALTGIRRASGRFLLWGLPFLLPDAPLWLHRLWNALLSTLPHLALGLLLARRARLSGWNLWLFGLWAFLFLGQGPIYTPLILSALVVVLFVRSGRPGWYTAVMMLATAAAGYYASLSRWTWLPAVPAWSAFLLLADFDLDGPVRSAFTPANLRRLLPAALTAMAGLAGGLLANAKLFQPQKLSQSTVLSQPLLWYRLWPNATYAEGVLIALAVAVLPAIVLLGWLAWSGRWKPNGLQAAAYIAALGVFLVGGIVASVKIGGGNNLHNLDLFLVSLVMLAALALRKRLKSSLQGESAPRSNDFSRFSWLRVALALAVLLPAWVAVRSGSPLKLPPQESTRKGLESLRSLVTEANAEGEVLFMDQRQLLTFGNIRGVTLVPEYEKKYMMDQAMAGDAAYFAGFYRDLADRRFALIVSDMQFKMVKDSSYAFGEENNVWVQWVSEPLLCYYMPLRTMQNVDIQLLVPNPDAQDCPAP